MKPEGPIVFAGEHLSYQQTCQEGAATSAHAALKILTSIAQAKAVTEHA
jgi:monoamine oxidase